MPEIGCSSRRRLTYRTHIPPSCLQLPVFIPAVNMCLLPLDDIAATCFPALVDPEESVKVSASRDTSRVCLKKRRHYPIKKKVPSSVKMPRSAKRTHPHRPQTGTDVTIQAKSQTPSNSNSNPALLRRTVEEDTLSGWSNAPDKHRNAWAPRWGELSRDSTAVSTGPAAPVAEGL